MTRWGVNVTVATCRHVLGDDDQPICRQTRGRFEEINSDRLRALLMALPVCARCRPVAWTRGLSLESGPVQGG